MDSWLHPHNAAEPAQEDAPLLGVLGTDVLLQDLLVNVAAKQESMGQYAFMVNSGECCGLPVQGDI